MIIHKGRLIAREDHDDGKFICKSGSTILLPSDEESIEMEYSSKGHTNVLASVERHYSSKQRPARADLRKFHAMTDRFMRYLSCKLRSDPIELDHFLLDYTKTKTEWT